MRRSGDHQRPAAVTADFDVDVEEPLEALLHPLLVMRQVVFTNQISLMFPDMNGLHMCQVIGVCPVLLVFSLSAN